jgi:hypothetical protein
MKLQKTAYRVFTQFVLNTEQYMVNQIKENETVRAHSINGGDKKYIQNFCQKTLKEETP